MIFRRGQAGFKDALQGFLDSYVYSDYPGLTGYAYHAEMIEESDGIRVMEQIARKIEAINPDGVYGHPEFKLRGETKWRSVVNTEDFPVPTDEPLEADEEEEGVSLAKLRRHPRTLFNGGRRG